MGAYGPQEAFDATNLAPTISQRDGLSAVYSFYNSKITNVSIGKYMIIDTINFVKDNKLKYLYLGYYIKYNNKMNYKNQFCPNEIFIKGKWI